MKRLGILAVPEYPTVVPYQQLYATLSFCGRKRKVLEATNG